MASVLVQTADAVVAVLNDSAHGFTQPFTAERSYAEWDLPLDDSVEPGRLYCDVVPRQGMTCEPESRGYLRYRPSVAIVFRKKFKLEDARTDNGRLILSAVDELIALLEQVNEVLAGELLADFTVAGETAHWDQSETEQIYMQEHIRKHNQFTGVLIVPYTSSKAVA